MPMPQNDTEAPLDGELELKKRSRRRLVGAIALALLAIVVLPMVMDHEPRQSAQDIQVRIPSQDAGGFTSRILPAKPMATPLPPAEPESKAEAKPETKPEAKAEAKTPEAAKPETKPAAKPPEPVKAPEKPVAKPAEPAKQPDKEAAKAEEARAKAALNGAAVSDQWVVQLGAYKEAANVKQLTAKLKQMGLPSYTEHFDSPQGARTRVRAGPFKTRDAADKARERIKTIGVGGTVAQQ
jgi:DedD protein